LRRARPAQREARALSEHREEAFIIGFFATRNKNFLNQIPPALELFN